jgi:ribonuclease J
METMGMRRDPMQKPVARARAHESSIPSPNGAIRVIPLGGVEEIGKNMTVIEYGDDIVIIDAGFQFREEDTPGVDYILPNTKYLEERKGKIRALVVTHGHLDHIGAIPYIMQNIGNPPIYSRLLTTVMIKKRQEEFPQMPALDIRVVEKEETITLGKLKINFFAVTHTIPDAMGIIVETPFGSIVHTGDLKLDHMDGVVSEKEVQEFSVFDKKNVLLLMADSTNVEKAGFSIPEATVHRNIEEIIKTTKSRLIIGTFASQLERIIKIIEICEQNGKRVVVEGRSMKNNIEIVKQLGLLKIKNETIISSQEMDSYPPDRIVALATGAQGDEFAALMRMANKTNKFFKITKRDTILLSSSIIPGNERAVQKLKDNLSRQGAKIIHYQVADVHSSGHANRDETAWIHNHIRPRFFIPVHGYHYMLRVHADVAISCGVPEKNVIIPDNGMIVDIVEEGSRIIARKERAPSGPVLVDGFSVGDVQEVVLRDRQMLAQDGMFVIIASVNPKTGKLRKSPDIISRGFVYLRESQDLLQQARIIIKKTVEDVGAGMHPINFDYIKGAISDNVGRFLFQKTNKRPIVIPVLIGI